jgi:hypothetical protein
VNCVKKLQADLKNNKTVNSSHLSKYAAASAVLHCTDGWVFLGRAIDSLTRANSGTACHLGYYAELRAAMSLLATQGVAVFDKEHFVLDRLGNLQQVPGKCGTHEIAWLALNHIADSNTAASLLGEAVLPGGIALKDWLDFFPPTTGQVPQPKPVEWLRQWGLDLQRLKDDQTARNEVSYRPTRLRSQSPLSVDDCSRFLRAFWESCEPSGVSNFEGLDRHLLRLCLEHTHHAVSGKSARATPRQFRDKLRAMLKGVAPSGASQDEWELFLMRGSQPQDSGIIREASGRLPVGHPRHHIQVLARAALLLRIACGECRILLKANGIGRSDLEFWWKGIGEDAGIWESGAEPSEFADLWSDVKAAVDDMQIWDAANKAKSPSFHRWRRELGFPISLVGETERVALWGLGL